MAKKKQKIQPITTPPKAPKPKPVPTPSRKGRKVLSEFKAWGPVSLTKLPRPIGPKVAGYVCMASWKVNVSEFEQDEFLETWDSIGRDPKRLFHGTRARSVSSITQEGLRPGRASCMFGRGIYFGYIEKALGFTGGQPWATWQRAPEEGHYVFEADVLLGCPLVATKAHKYSLRELRGLNYDSVHGRSGYTASYFGSLRNDEWVVYSRDQVLLVNLHEYHSVDQNYFTPPPVTPPPAVEGPCALMTDKPVSVGKKRRAFKDLLGRKVCGKTGYVKLTLKGRGTIWVCNDCIQEHRLRVGSKVPIKDTRTGKEIQAKIIHDHSKR